MRALPSVAALAALAAPAAAVDVLGIDIHGFASQGWMKSDENNYLGGTTSDGSFEFNEFGVNVSAEPLQNLRIGAQLFARDLGDLGDDELTLDWAYGDYRLRDWLGLRAGRVRLPYGLYNETRDVDMLRASVLLPQSVYIESYRDVTTAVNGGAVYGSAPLAAAGALDYQFFVGTNTAPENNSVARVYDGMQVPAPPLGNLLIDIDDTDIGLVYGGQVLWSTPLPGLRLGASIFFIELELSGSLTVDSLPAAFQGRSSFEADNLRVPTLSAEYVVGNLTLAAEWLQILGDVDVEFVLPTPPLPPTTLSATDSVDSEGWYVSAAYRFNRWIELGAYYSHYVGDDDASAGARNNHQYDTALSVRFDISDNFLIKLEGHYIDGYAQVRRSENLDDDGNDAREPSFWMFAAKTTFNF